MQEKQFKSVKALVFNDLKFRQENNEDIFSISSKYISRYYSELLLNKSHLVTIPLREGTVNRYVELYCKQLETNTTTKQ